MSNVAYVEVEYCADDGTRSGYRCAPGSRLHREALEHEAAGCCVVIVEITHADLGAPL